eukprot:TRINITY_DN13869_c0_g1_i2.p1 TRINITY_DN13869_c0_g1~~TRINITY_DN13869_c0_g1_i2.p1  ORF type:complete len:198 (-),score=46.09 TRINITY_DN13869_c0_g1_i2:55-648(-)
MAFFKRRRPWRLTLCIWAALQVAFVAGPGFATRGQAPSRTIEALLRRRDAIARVQALALLGPGMQSAGAEVVRMTNSPLPKAYRDAVVAAAEALKDALDAEETAGNAYISQAAEAQLAAKEKKAGDLIRSYGQSYISEKTGLRPDDKLRESPVFYFMDEAIDIFRDAVQKNTLPKQRLLLIGKLRQVLELAEQAGTV